MVSKRSPLYEQMLVLLSWLFSYDGRICRAKRVRASCNVGCPNFTGIYGVRFLTYWQRKSVQQRFFAQGNRVGKLTLVEDGMGEGGCENITN